MVQSGSDGAAQDGLSAWFELRQATWSDGTGIGFFDLERTLDDRLVSSMDAPDAHGRIVVHFRHALPGWRSLWSDIAAPKSNVFGGPFAVQSVVSGATTTLVRNANWFAPSFLDSIELNYVPDPTMAQRLIAAGRVDVIQPVADTQRTPQYSSLDGVKVQTSTEGGRWVALQFNATSASEVYRAPPGVIPKEAVRWFFVGE